MSNETPIENESGKPSSRRVSRRTILKAGLGILGSVIVSRIPDVFQAKPAISHQDTEDPFASMNVDELKALIEKDFQIELLPGATTIPISEPVRNISTPITIPWEVEDLRKLAKALSELPPHFYEPKQRDGEKRIFHVGLSQELGTCFCGGDPIFNRNRVDPKDTILLKQDALRTSGFFDDRNYQGKEPALFQVVHEFTHAVTHPDINKYTRG